MIILGLFGKFCAVFVTIPDPIIGGIYMVMFGESQICIFAVNFKVRTLYKLNRFSQVTWLLGIRRKGVGVWRGKHPDPFRIAGSLDSITWVTLQELSLY